jgi:hypothetical protein
LQRRFVYSLTAPTGGGKTAIALFLSVAVGGADLTLGNHQIESGRVLYLAGENPDDIRMRYLAMADKFDFDVPAMDVHFVPGAIPIDQMFDRLAKEIDSIGDVSLIVVDTSAAYFGGEDENDNVQMGKHARTLTTLPGGPCVLVCCHPTKNASSDNLLPRGGGSFIAEMDGNLTGNKKESIVELHWQGKFRGPDFSPIGFQLLTVTCEALKDTKGRLVPTVVAKPLTEAVRADLQHNQRRDEDALLILMLQAPGGTTRAEAEALGWSDRNGPAHYRVVRVLKKLREYGYVKDERGEPVLTDKGKDAARKAAGRAA